MPAKLSESTAAPFAKWAGGKGRLIEEILKRLPDTIHTYYEPFVGGGAVFFALAREGRFRRAILSDTNTDLMDGYRAIRWNVANVIQLLRRHAERHDSEYYYEVRAQDRDVLDLYERAARFIYLNRTCFNGLYRVNKAGRFNVPLGDYKAPRICDEAGLEAVATVLSYGVELLDDNFAEVGNWARRGDAVYFDPPYLPTSKTANFASYHVDGFGLDEQRRLVKSFQFLTERKIDVVLSQADVPLAHELYAGTNASIDCVQAPRRINSKGSARGNVSELLICSRHE